MLALADPETNKQLSWDDLVEEGVADLLVEEGWVLPGKKVIPPFLIELMGRKSKALLLFKNRWTTIY